MTGRRIELRIEELILDGFPPADRDRIAAAVERELGRLLAEAGPETRFVDGRAVLDGGSFEMGPRSGAAQVGQHVARSLFAGLVR